MLPTMSDTTRTKTEKRILDLLISNLIATGTCVVMLVMIYAVTTARHKVIEAHLNLNDLRYYRDRGEPIPDHHRERLLRDLLKGP